MDKTQQPKALTKTQIRAGLLDNNIDLSNDKVVAGALKYPRNKFRMKLEAVMTKYNIPAEKYKQQHILPANLVEIIFKEKDKF